MRIPITVHSDPFDIEAVQPEIDRARYAFADYLGQVPRKSTKSKHGLMGPVGKILSEVKSGRRDPASLKGYAVSVHEAAVAQIRRSGGRSALSPAAMADLDGGITALVGLLRDAPVQFHDQLIDRLDYGLYWELRKRESDSKEMRRQAWIRFVREKYGAEETLADAWNEAGISFEELYIPKKAEGARGKRATVKQADIAAFWESQGASTLAEEEEEES